MRTVMLLVCLSTGCLTYDQFAERVVDRNCEEQERCSPADLAGNCELYEVPGAEDCDFDGGAAGRCLRQDWVCNTSQPGFEFAEPPTACDVVCRDPVEP